MGTRVEHTYNRRNRDALEKQLREFERSVVAVGYPSPSPKHKGALISVAGLAIVHEFGSEKQNIPARPFMRQTVKHTEAERPKKIAQFYRAVKRGRIKAKDALKALGVWYEGEIQRTIDRGNFAPLSPATIAQKRSSKPLIDTGELKRSVTSKVERK